jgi:hypothetical protein
MRISRIMLILLSVALLVSASFLFTACGSSSGGGGGGGGEGTIKGTLTIDKYDTSTDGAEYAVFVDDNQDPSDGMVTEMHGNAFPNSDTTNYSITGVPDGTYYVYVGIYTVSSYPGSLGQDDYLGVYGASGDNCLDLFLGAQPVKVSGGTATADITVYKLTTCF